MEEKNQPGDVSQSGQAFFVKAAIDERGPKELKVVPSYHQYLIYQDDTFLTSIQQNDEGEWEQIEGELTNGVIALIGQAIRRKRSD